MLLESVLPVSQHLQTLAELVHLVQVWASQLQQHLHVHKSILTVQSYTIQCYNKIQSVLMGM
jgi:hypothetical protein